ncbi:MAG: phosphoribosylformylglycinamidine synthase subunit PurS [Defluviitaleaceae bacterium]|nr:phosphoribosylformylglycinamidine synthase subunit PurS [Defluviitaleaceae bacterium]
MYKAKITITPRKNVPDPEGQFVETALQDIGFDGVHNIRIGKYITLDIDADTAWDAQAQAEAMCRLLLAKTSMETYRIAIEDAS